MEFMDDSDATDRDPDERRAVAGIPLAHQAAASGDTDALSRAIQADPSILEHHDTEGYTPLAHAVMAEQFDSVKMLVKMGASINSQDKMGRSGLAMAAYQGWYDGMVFLMRNGAKLNMEDKFGRTPLHAATYAHQPRALARLLQSLSCENVNQQDNEGMTALHWCAFHNRPLHIELLWHKGADPFIQDVDGETALHWAAHNGSVSCCEQLLINPHGRKLVNMMDISGKTALHLAAAAGQTTVIKVLSRIHACDLHAEDPDQRTALHWAAATGHASAVRLLLHLQVNANAIDVEGTTPLMYARQFKHLDCVRILEHLGVKEPLKPVLLPSSVNKPKQTPAQKNKKTPLEYIVEFFRSKKNTPAPEISDDSGATFSESSDGMPDLVTSEVQEEPDIAPSQDQHRKSIENCMRPLNLAPNLVNAPLIKRTHFLPPVKPEGKIKSTDEDSPHGDNALPEFMKQRSNLEDTAAVILGKDTGSVALTATTARTNPKLLEPVKPKKIMTDINLEISENKIQIKPPKGPLAPLRGHLPQTRQVQETPHSQTTKKSLRRKITRKKTVLSPGISLNEVTSDN